MNDAARNPWPLAGAALGLGLLVGFLGGRNESPLAPPINPQLRALDANVWQHTAAEYRACCWQAYALASRQLKAKLAALPAQGLPPAVVMDLDETVLDNAAFQTALYRQGVTFKEPLWERWARDYSSEVGLVPGAADFIATAEKAGVKVIYITNRNTTLREPTIAGLRNLKINLDGIDKRLMLATTTRDKTDRMNEARKAYRVLLWVGDNLRDFEDRFRADRVDGNDLEAVKNAIARRAATVDAARGRFGDDWIILPNPMYGEWPLLLGARPEEVLRATKMTQ